jgi:hypothetical protein
VFFQLSNLNLSILISHVFTLFSTGKNICFRLQSEIGDGMTGVYVKFITMKAYASLAVVFIQLADCPMMSELRFQQETRLRALGNGICNGASSFGRTVASNCRFTGLPISLFVLSTLVVKLYKK